MKLFQVEPDTSIIALTLSDFNAGSMSLAKPTKTKNRNVFDLEHLVCDPVHPEKSGKWEAYALTGWYGFRRAGHVMLVPGSSVKVM